MIQLSDIRILLVEDNYIDALKIKNGLESYGAQLVSITDTIKDTLIQCTTYQPHVVLVDLALRGDDNGIELINQLMQKKIPCIVITQNRCDKVFNEIIKKFDLIYLLKPVTALTVYSSIMVVLDNQSHYSSEYVFIKGTQNEFIKVKYSEIYYLKSDGNYTYIYTLHRKYVMKTPLKDFLDKLDDKFIRVHKSIVVNTRHITSAGYNFVQLGDIRLPVGISYRKSIEKKISGE